MKEFGDPHEGDGERAEHVADGDALRHGGHWNEESHRQADRGADHESDDDQVVADDLVVEECADDCEEHAHRGELHAASRRIWLGEAAKAEDERRRSGNVGDLDEECANLRVHFGASVFLNILSMRSVITNPPTTLMVAAATATAPMTLI